MADIEAGKPTLQPKSKDDQPAVIVRHGQFKLDEFQLSKYLIALVTALTAGNTILKVNDLFHDIETTTFQFLGIIVYSCLLVAYGWVLMPPPEDKLPSRKNNPRYLWRFILKTHVRMWLYISCSYHLLVNKHPNFALDDGGQLGSAILSVVNFHWILIYLHCSMRPRTKTILYDVVTLLPSIWVMCSFLASVEKVTDVHIGNFGTVCIILIAMSFYPEKEFKLKEIKTKGNTIFPKMQGKDKNLNKTDPKVQEKDKKVNKTDPKMQEKDKKVYKTDPKVQEKDKKMDETNQKVQEKNKDVNNTDPKVQEKDKKVNNTDPKLQEKPKKKKMDVFTMTIDNGNLLLSMMAFVINVFLSFIVYILEVPAGVNVLSMNPFFIFYCISYGIDFYHITPDLILQVGCCVYLIFNVFTYIIWSYASYLFSPTILVLCGMTLHFLYKNNIGKYTITEEYLKQLKELVCDPRKILATKVDEKKGDSWLYANTEEYWKQLKEFVCDPKQIPTTKVDEKKGDLCQPSTSKGTVVKSSKKGESEQNEKIVAGQGKKNSSSQKENANTKKKEWFNPQWTIAAISLVLIGCFFSVLFNFLISTFPPLKNGVYFSTLFLIFMLYLNHSKKVVSALKSLGFKDQIAAYDFEMKRENHLDAKMVYDFVIDEIFKIYLKMSDYLLFIQYGTMAVSVVYVRYFIYNYETNMLIVFILAKLTFLIATIARHMYNGYILSKAVSFMVCQRLCSQAAEQSITCAFTVNDVRLLELEIEKINYFSFNRCWDILLEIVKLLTHAVAWIVLDNTTSRVEYNFRICQFLMLVFIILQVGELLLIKRCYHTDMEKKKNKIKQFGAILLSQRYPAILMEKEKTDNQSKPENNTAAKLKCQEPVQVTNDLPAKKDDQSKECTIDIDVARTDSTSSDEFEVIVAPST